MQSEYLHNAGTDRLIADVLAFDPSKVNPAEQDEVDTATTLPLARIGQGDYARDVVGNADGTIGVEPSPVAAHSDGWRLGVRAGGAEATRLVYDMKSIPLLDRIALVAKIDAAMSRMANH